MCSRQGEVFLGAGVATTYPGIWRDSDSAWCRWSMLTQTCDIALQHNLVCPYHTTATGVKHDDMHPSLKRRQGTRLNSQQE
jgi:hypothetical protein